MIAASCIPAPVTAQETTESPAADSLRVMSFNIRYGKANDGENHWRHRHDLVTQAIKEFGPDLMGTQETLAFQADFLRKALPEYSYVGRSREADNESGEQCGIFFRTERFTKLAEGHFWLSTEPDRPGSKSWDSSLPRMASWTKLWDKKTEQAIFLFNTHFDHRGKKARAESAALIRRQIGKLAGDSPVILTGDFNAAESSDPYQALFGKTVGSVQLTDTFRDFVPALGKTEGTFNGFKGTNTGGRIDWVAATGQFEIESASIFDWNANGRYPSDHFPVTSVLKLKSAK